MTLPEELEAAVRGGDETAIRQLFLDLPEDGRAGLLPTGRALVAAEVRQGIDAVGRLGPMLLAAYGTLAVTELRKLGWRSNHLPAGLEDVLRRRSPERLQPIVEHLLDDVGGRAWPPVRALVRDGILPRPDRPSYTIAMLAATQYRGAAEVVAGDPGLLDDEIWRLFEVEGGGEDSLASHEKYTGDSWGDLFRDLAARDAAMRQRLLDASLAALARDFATFRAGWFSRFHESLAPTVEERAERATAYLGLLRSRSGPTVSFTVAALARISRSGRLPVEMLLERIGPVLQEGPAGTAKTALGLVAEAGADGHRADAAAIVATGALAHPSPDVQRSALKLVETLVHEPDEAVAGALADRIDDVAASQRAAATVLLGRLGGQAQPESAPDRSPERIGPGSPIVPAMASPDRQARPSPLDPARAVRPLDSLDALIDAAVSVVESGESADDVERILETVGRLAAGRPEGFARSTAALARRARTILGRRESTPFNGFDARADIAGVLLAWTTGEVVAPSPGYSPVDPGAGAFLSARASEVAVAAGRRTAFRSVAAPTHGGGWIDPVVLVERLATHPPASRLDLVAALLRLAPERQAEALSSAIDLAGEVGAVVRYALGGDEPIGPTAAWWVAAARVRAPSEDDERVENRHPGLGPDAGRAARAAIIERGSRMTTATVLLEVEPRPAGTVAVELPTVLMHRDPSPHAWTGRSTPAMLRWMATIQPGYREAWASVGSLVMARNVDWWSAEWANRVFLEPFIDPVTSIGPMAARLIGIALGAKEAGERGLATDIVRLALVDGRMTDEALARGLKAAAALGCDRPNRWAISLADVGATSGSHARAVASAIAGTLSAIADRRASALVPLLRLLDELLAATGAAPGQEGQAPLRVLAERSGQSGRLARSILSRA